MASKSMTCPALLVFFTMTLLVAVQSQLLPCPPGCRGTIALTDINIQEIERFAERVEKAVDFQTIPCPLSCRGNIRIFQGGAVDVQDIERWRERILQAIDLPNILDNGLRDVDPVTRAAADVVDVAEKNKA